MAARSVFRGGGSVFPVFESRPVDHTDDARVEPLDDADGMFGLTIWDFYAAAALADAMMSKRAERFTVRE